jgi:hypothetical protein
MIESIVCPHCLKYNDVPPAGIGRYITCQNCGSKYYVYVPPLKDEQSDPALDALSLSMPSHIVINKSERDPPAHRAARATVATLADDLDIAPDGKVYFSEATIGETICDSELRAKIQFAQGGIHLCSRQTQGRQKLRSLTRRPRSAAQ